MESVEDIPRDAILGGAARGTGRPTPSTSTPCSGMRPGAERRRPRRPLRDALPRDGRALARADERADARRAETGCATSPRSPSPAARSGYSTSRILLHTVPDGRYVPGTYAPIDEYLALADGMNDAGGGLFQAVNDFDTKRGSTSSSSCARWPSARRRAVRRRAGQRRRGHAGVDDVWGAFLADTHANVGPDHARYTHDPAERHARAASPRSRRSRASVEGAHDAADAGGPRRRAEGPRHARRARRGGQAKGMLVRPASYIYPLGTGVRARLPR